MENYPAKHVNDHAKKNDETAATVKMEIKHNIRCNVWFKGNKKQLIISKE